MNIGSNGMRKPRALQQEAFGITVDLLTIDESIEAVTRLIEGDDPHFKYVVTPNVDHVVNLRKHAGFRRAYSAASLCVVDGWPVAAVLSALCGFKVPTVPGSDLVPKLFESLNERKVPARVFLLGAPPGVAEAARDVIERNWPHLIVVGTFCPPFGFEKSPQEEKSIQDAISEARPDILIVGLGAPKQELWCHRNRDSLPKCVAICAGATIDFIAGSKTRAPEWLKVARLEWLFRLAQEPRRLAGRYMRGAIIFPVLSAREWLSLKIKKS
ncbi:WecB/TagA/CpsF family glycosyltransferase [Stenotrophomonas sp.]|uniref:WecB/TagA/CpsF family glycosyltransferase n=1 Tax=Stenotrophomonas sp. TaxID=69392 RepID=UPI0028A6AC3B|nr:WecB/TagA/CpsF family glycosyltransferase [Stenotrophomonas sp.]